MSLNNTDSTKETRQPFLIVSLYNSVTDYQTFKSDFFKLVEFTEWLKENYPERMF